MGPTLVPGQTKASSSSGSSVTALFTSSVTAGNCIAVVVACDSNTVPSTTAVTDNNSNTYTRIASQAGGVNTGGGSPTGACAIYLAVGVHAGSTTVTFSNAGNAGGATFVAISVAEFTAAQSGADGTSGNNASSAGTPNPGNVTTTNADDVVVVGATDEQENVTWSAGTGYTLGSVVTSATNTTVALQFQSFSTSGSKAAAFANTTTSFGWSAVAAGIKGATTSFTWQQSSFLPELSRPPMEAVGY